MGVFQHDGFAMIGGVPRDLAPVDETSRIVIYQVKIVPLPRIIPQPEVPDKIILRIYILHKEIGREPGADHDLRPHVDGMDVQVVVGLPLRECDVVEFIAGRKNEAGREINIEFSVESVPVAVIELSEIGVAPDRNPSGL
jgi:hypothetical protein